VNTDDGQAVLIVPPDGIQARAGETSVRVTITPLDPATLGKPPAGMSYDGNAYRIDAVYSKSKQPAVIPIAKCPNSLTQASKCATVVLRFVYAGAKDIYRRDGDSWTPLGATVTHAALQAYGDTNMFGTFVVLGSESKEKASGGGNFLAFALGLGAILIGTAAAAMRAKRSRRTKKRKRPPLKQKKR
jgi:hypothetical protein